MGFPANAAAQSWYKDLTAQKILSLEYAAAVSESSSNLLMLLAVERGDGNSAAVLYQNALSKRYYGDLVGLTWNQLSQRPLQPLQLLQPSRNQQDLDVSMVLQHLFWHAGQDVLDDMLAEVLQGPAVESSGGLEPGLTWRRILRVPSSTDLAAAAGATAAAHPPLCNSSGNLNAGSRDHPQQRGSPKLAGLLTLQQGGSGSCSYRLPGLSSVDAAMVGCARGSPTPCRQPPTGIWASIKSFVACQHTNLSKVVPVRASTDPGASTQRPGASPKQAFLLRAGSQERNLNGSAKMSSSLRLTSYVPAGNPKASLTACQYPDKVLSMISSMRGSPQSLTLGSSQRPGSSSRPSSRASTGNGAASRHTPNGTMVTRFEERQGTMSDHRSDSVAGSDTAGNGSLLVGAASRQPSATSPKARATHDGLAALAAFQSRQLSTEAASSVPNSRRRREAVGGEVHHIVHFLADSLQRAQAEAEPPRRSPPQQQQQQRQSPQQQRQSLQQQSLQQQQQQPPASQKRQQSRVGAGDDDEDNDEEEEEVWHEVGIGRLQHPLDREKSLLVVSQTDVTERAQLEATLARLTEAQLDMLSQIFPRHVLDTLLMPRSGESGEDMVVNDMASLARSHSDVTILFMDIAGFTNMCRQLQPHQVLAFVNRFFSVLDALADRHNVQKVDTSGDSYIVAAGVVSNDDDGFLKVHSHHDPYESAARVMAFALDLQEAAKTVFMPHNGQPVNIRIGVHSGPCVSGVVGRKVPKFTIFGDTMNTASRMESTSTPGRIQSSAATYNLLIKGGYTKPEEWEPTGGVEVKGKGTMETYYWAGRAKAPVSIPSPKLQFAHGSSESLLADELSGVSNVISRRTTRSFTHPPAGRPSALESHMEGRGGKQVKQIQPVSRRKSAFMSLLKALSISKTIMLSGNSYTLQSSPNSVSGASAAGSAAIRTWPMRSKAKTVGAATGLRLEESNRREQ